MEAEPLEHPFTVIIRIYAFLFKAFLMLVRCLAIFHLFRAIFVDNILRDLPQEAQLRSCYQ